MTVDLLRTDGTVAYTWNPGRRAARPGAEPAVARHARRRRWPRPAATRSGSTPRRPPARAPAARPPRPATARDAFDLLPHIFPVRGRHNFGQGGARFGAGRGGRSHQGQDVMAKCGTRMVAARGGRVKAKAYHRAAGNYLVITGSRTGQDYVYMHLTEPSAFDKGDRVLTGQRIGTVGDTGNARGCHLHFELWRRPRLVQRRPPVQPPPRPAGVGLLLLAAPRSRPRPGKNRPDPRGVGRVALAVGGRAGRAPRPGGLDLQRDDAGRSRPPPPGRSGTSRASPIEVGIMPLKIGLRTMAKGPSVTRSVRSSGSTPMRHERPIATWATRVVSRPAANSTTPATWPTVAVERADRLHHLEQVGHRGRDADQQRDHEQHAADPLHRAQLAADALEARRAGAPQLDRGAQAEGQRAGRAPKQASASDRPSAAALRPGRSSPRPARSRCPRARPRGDHQPGCRIEPPEARAGRFPPARPAPPPTGRRIAGSGVPPRWSQANRCARRCGSWPGRAAA